MSIAKKIELRAGAKQYVTIYSKYRDDSSSGYIVAHSSDFIVLQEIHDFFILGYVIFAVGDIAKVRYNSFDQYFEMMMLEEKITDKIGLMHNIDLTNHQTIFTSIKALGLNVIVEGLMGNIHTFNIGPIAKIKKKSVHIQYFNAKGELDEDFTKIPYKEITLIKFDDHYTNIFSKYLRNRESENKVEE